MRMNFTIWEKVHFLSDLFYLINHFFHSFADGLPGGVASFEELSSAQ